MIDCYAQVFPQGINCLVECQYVVGDVHMIVDVNPFGQHFAPDDFNAQHF
jgi:hypothetical protein